MKYNEFVDKVSEYGWEKTRFQGHSSVVFVHRNKEGKMDAYFYLSDLKMWYHSYKEIFVRMKNFEVLK